MRRYLPLMFIYLSGLSGCMVHEHAASRRAGGGLGVAGGACSNCVMPARHVIDDASADSCRGLDSANRFGEVVSAYTGNTVVYVYNFSPNPALRRFYKIVRDADSLYIQQVNMSKQVVSAKQEVYLKIVNVNRFLYDVGQGDTAAGWEERPSILFDHSYLSDTGFECNAPCKVDQQADPKADSVDSLVKSFLKMNNELEADLLQAYNPCVVFRCCDPKWILDYTTLANKLLDIRLAGGPPKIPRLPAEADLRKAVVLVNNLVRWNQEAMFPLIPGGSYVDVHFNIRLDDSVRAFFSLPIDQQPVIQYEVPVCCKWIISFSGGPFLGLSSGLRNTTYAWQQIPDNTNTVQDTGRYALIANGFTLPPYGFTMLCHLQNRMSHGFGLGFSGGVGLSFGPRLSGDVLGGVSAFVGDMQQFVITAGLLGTEVNQLTNQWQNISSKGILYVTPPPAISYYKEFKTGLFLSLTYTPGHP